MLTTFIASLYIPGPPVVERVSPYYIALTPPETLILEIAPTGYTRITWLFRGPAGEDILPLDPRRFELEDYSKRAMLLGTVAADRGVYEADVHTINGDVITVDFFVGTIGKCWPEYVHLNLLCICGRLNLPVFLYCFACKLVPTPKTSTPTNLLLEVLATKPLLNFRGHTCSYAWKV